MYAQKQIIYPDNKKRAGDGTDLLDFAVHIITFFTVLFLIKLVFEDTAAPLGFGICFTYLAFLFFTVFYLFSKQKSFPIKAVFPLALCVVSAVSIAVHQYTFSLIIPYMFYLSGLFCMTMTGTNGTEGNSYLDLYLQLKAMLFIPVSKLFVPLTSVIKNIGILRNKKHLGVIIGFICGIPVFLVVASLLVDGDAAFSSVMTGFLEKLDELFFSNDDSLTTLFLIPTLIFTPYIVSTVFCFRHGHIKQKINSGITQQNAKGLRFVPSSALCGFYGVVALCYVVYLFSQLTYLFGAFSGKAPDGVTASAVSEYARRGFFEMSAVAFINLCLIALGAICSKRDSRGNVSKYYKGFSAFFCLFTMLLIITAMSKMVLYISGMGLTHKRIVVSLIDIVLFVAFLCIFIKLFVGKFPYMKAIMYTFLILTTLYFAVSPEYVIASYNTNAYLSGKHKEVDLECIRGEYMASDYAPMICLDKIAQSENSYSQQAKFFVYGIYSSHMRYCDRTIHNSVGDHLLHKYLTENEERLKTYKEAYDIKFYCLENYPIVFPDYTKDVFLVSFDTEKKIESIKFENELTKDETYDREYFEFYEDGYEYVELSEIDVYEASEMDVYIDYPNDRDFIADITVTEKGGKVYNCKMKKEKGNQSRYFSIRDDGKGGLTCIQTEAY